MRVEDREKKSRKKTRGRGSVGAVLWLRIPPSAPYGGREEMWGNASIGGFELSDITLG